MTKEVGRRGRNWGGKEEKMEKGGGHGKKDNEEKKTVSSVGWRDKREGGCGREGRVGGIQ